MSKKFKIFTVKSNGEICKTANFVDSLTPSSLQSMISNINSEDIRYSFSSIHQILIERFG